MTPGLLRRAVLAPAVVLFLILVAHAVLETARDALFLARLGPDRLAWAYVVMAGAALLAVAGARRWGGGRDPRRMLLAFIALAMVGTTVLAMTIPTQRSAVFVLYVWTGLVATLVVPAFWTVIDRSLRVTEAKQVFGAIGAGAVLGAMVGSALAGALGRVVAAQALVPVGAGAFGVALIAAALLVPHVGPAEQPPQRRPVETLSRRSARYVRLLIIVELMSMIALTLGDLMFKRILADRLATGDLASAFGAIYTGLNVIALAIQLFVTPRLLMRRGVGSALMVLPLVLMTTALGFAMTGALIAVVALKLGDGGLRHSLNRVATEILFLPVPAVVRDGWKPMADAIGQRGGQAVAALLVFALGALGVGARLLAVVTASAGALWVATIALTRRAYVAQFRDTLKAGEVQRDVRVPELDADSAALLTEALSSPDEVEAIAALELLARGGRVPALVLYHPRAAVVQHALSLLEGTLRPDVERVVDHLLAHSEPRIRAVALAVASRAGLHRDQLAAAVHDPDPDVRAVALVALASDPAHAERAVAGITALASGSTADRAALARAVGYAPDERFRTLLYQLIERREPPVVREVLHVLSRAPALADLDNLLLLLEDPHVRASVRHVFRSLGSAGQAHLIAALEDPRTPVAVRRHLPRTISRFGSRRAAAALIARLAHEPDGTTEFKILRALGRMRANDPELPIDPGAIEAYAWRAIGKAARYATYGDLLDAAGVESPSAALIRELLDEKARWAFEHAFRALGILYPRADLRSVHDALVSGNEARWSAACEIIESLVPAELRVPLLAVVDHVPADVRRARIGALAPGPFASYAAFMAALLADPSESLRCVVAYHVAERRLIELRDELVRLHPPGEPRMVAHAFDQAIARLDA